MENVILNFQYNECLNEKSNKKLASVYNVSPTMISNIRNKKGWYGEVINGRELE